VANDQCCHQIRVTASNMGAVGLNQSAYLGFYTLDGALNGHPIYHMNRQGIYDAYLKYKKTGIIKYNEQYLI
jgi:hypothetical protein